MRTCAEEWRQKWTKMVEAGTFEQRNEQNQGGSHRKIGGWVRGKEFQQPTAHTTVLRPVQGKFSESRERAVSPSE